ncbi:PAS domain-containing protein [Halomicroarcula sp. F13]|uniref:histidine kinase n=1 Tax=Haloarcula rubra TaxID=2487747 RepID=A0AAW4PYR2_9EURY|nr:PAS domain-containing protein [Halomicroarcula rubra]MBX0325635.1 PAS domain-containing protein [Halomicroarcula rubra]
MVSSLPNGGPERQFLVSAVEMVPNSAAILGADGTVLATNSAWEDGAETTDDWLHSAAAGEDYLTALDTAETTSADRVATGVRELLQGTREQFEIEFTVESSDRRRWFSTHATTVIHDGAKHATVTHRETTARKDGQRVLREACEISTAPDRSFGEKITTLLELGQNAIGIDYATLSRVQDDQYIFESVATQSSADLQGTTVPLADLPNCERVVEQNQTLVLRDVKAQAPELVGSEWGIASYLGAPVTVNGEVYGTFCFYSIDPRAEAFPDWAVTFVECLSNWVGHELERREREERLEQIKTTVSDVVWITSPEKDEIEFVSDSYEDVWGRPTETLRTDAKSFVDAIHSDDRERVQEALGAQQTNPDAYEETYRVVQPDGEIRWIHDRSSGIYDDNGTLRAIVGIASDVTERKKREQKYQRLTERITDAYYAFDSDWNVTYWNDTVADRGDMPAADILGKDFWDVYPELEETVFGETLREAMESQEPKSCEYYTEAEDYWVELQAYPDEGGLSVISQEITERKEAREALRESQERLDAFVTATSDVVYRMSSDWSEMRYMDGQEFIADTDNPRQTWLEEYIPPDERPRVTAAIEEAIETRSRFELEHQVVQVDGTRGWIHSRAVPILDDDGEIVEWFGTATDISDRKKREQTLAQQRDDLTQLKRLNTLVRNLTQALQNTTTREGIETAVCERLTDSDLYQTVWVGRRSQSGSNDPTIVPQTSAGINDAYLDRISGGEPGPASVALQAGELQVIDNISTADRFPDSRREIALESGHHSLAAVPIATDETTYGVLVVYTPEEHTISEAEQAVLTDLGRSIALAIQRVHSQRSLTAETAVALDFQMPDAAIDFAEVTTELGCELELEQRVPISDGGHIYYLTVLGGDPAEVCNHLDDGQLDAESEVVRPVKNSEPALIETHLEEIPRLPLDVLTDYGASMTRARAEDGDISLSVELPPGVTVGPLLADLREIVPGIEVVSKRHVDRPMKTVTAMREQVNELLTPKQEATLKAAYSRGYYRWPRDTTVEEIADTFDISSPALHYRLRKAHDTVVSVLLDE